MQSTLGRACSYYGIDYDWFNRLLFKNNSLYYRSVLHWKVVRQFCERFPRYSVQRILDNHSLLPFFSWFNRRAALLASLLVADGYCQNYGFSRHPLVSWKYKFCPECAREQYQQYGEVFWLRDHQIYGVNLCLKHDRPLIETTLPISGKGLPRSIGFITNNLVTDTHELEVDQHSRLIASTAHELARERISKPVNTKMWMRYLCMKYGRPTMDLNEQMRILESEPIRKKITDYWGPSYCEKLGWQYPLANLRGHEWWGWLKLLKAIDPEASLINSFKESIAFAKELYS